MALQSVRLHESASRSTSGFNETLEYFRFISIIVIVLFHADAVGGFYVEIAVAFFTTVSMYLLVSKIRNSSVIDLNWYRQRATRLLRPFLVWLAVYVLAKIIQCAVEGASIYGDLLRWSPPNGSWSQLWFLPYAAALSAIPLVARASFARARCSTPYFLAVLLACLGLSMLAIVILNAVALPLFFRLMLLYFPAALLGVALGVSGVFRGAVWFTAFAFVALGVALALGGFDKAHAVYIAPVLVAFAIAVPAPQTRAGRIIGPVTFAIYLVHMLIIPVVARTPFDPSAADGAALVVLASFVVSVVIASTRLSRIFL